MHPPREVGSTSPPVVQLELVDTVNGQQLVACGAAQPTGEGGDGDADVREGVIGGARVEWCTAQRGHSKAR